MCFLADISAGEESSNSHSKRESQCSSDHPDAKQTRLAGIVVSDNSSCMACGSPLSCCDAVLREGM